MGLRSICLGCMEDKGEEKVCHMCGWEEGNTPESPLHLKPGTILKGQYLIGRVLGHGGFGITYLASDLSLGAKLAIKEYFPQGMATRNVGDTAISVYSGNTQEHFEYGLEKFIEEAKTLARFDDISEIVTIKDFFKENGTAYLVMSYIEGVTLKEYLVQNGGRLPLDAVLNVMMPVMKALEHIHKAGILHRDISPDNIYITRNFNIKLLDFGAARFAMGEHSKSLSVLLKPGYAPEEQYRTRGKQGPWTDVYAVAATMYKALTGETPPEALDRLEEDNIIPLSELGVELPDYIWEAMKKALAVRGFERYQLIENFYTALEADCSTPQNHASASAEESDSKTLDTSAACMEPDSSEPEISPKPANARPFAAVFIIISVGVLLVIAFMVSMVLHKPMPTSIITAMVTQTPKITPLPLHIDSSTPVPTVMPQTVTPDTPARSATPAPKPGATPSSPAYSPLSSISLIVNSSSPQKTNTSIGLTARVAGGSNNKSYKFYVKNRSQGGWVQINYNGYSNYCVWKPVTAGPYVLKVMVEDNGSSLVSSELNFEIVDNGIYADIDKDVYKPIKKVPSPAPTPNRDIYPAW